MHFPGKIYVIRLYITNVCCFSVALSSVHMPVPLPDLLLLICRSLEAGEVSVGMTPMAKLGFLSPGAETEK